MGPFQWISKLALFSLILSAFSPLKHTRILVYLGATVSFIGYWGLAIYVMVVCRPRRGTSRESFLEGMAGPSCASTTGGSPIVNLSNGVISLVTDIYIFVLPLPAVWRLRLPMRKKLGVAVVFLVAFG